MSKENNEITIEFLDHVAIRVKDLDISANWYQEVLCLKKYHPPKWEQYPIFMFAGKSGVALFPANQSDPQPDPHSKNVKIDHFAFNVTHDNFEKAKKHFQSLNLDWTFQDHHYFHSIYTKDPDGHTVELTTLIVYPDEFYKD